MLKFTKIFSELRWQLMSNKPPPLVHIGSVLWGISRLELSDPLASEPVIHQNEQWERILPRATT